MTVSGSLTLFNADVGSAKKGGFSGMNRIDCDTDYPVGDFREFLDLAYLQGSMVSEESIGTQKQA